MEVKYMTKKLSVMVLMLVLVAGGMVYAATNEDGTTAVPFELTEEQKAELESIWSQTDAIREQMLEKMVEFGAISPERAQWMKDGWELRESEGYQFGPGFGGRGFGGGFGPCHGNYDQDARYGRSRGRGYGMMGGRGW